jgi:two-component system sensor histidine kinase KdpD
MSNQAINHYREESLPVSAQLPMAAITVRGQRRSHAARVTPSREAGRLPAPAEGLRSGLATSLPHDLRTPLASILASITSLRIYSQAFDPATKEHLMSTIQDDAERLNRFIANLLDMTRLDAGAITPRLAPVSLSELVESTVARAGRVLLHHRVEVRLPADLPPVDLDFLLAEQALFNLLDNAAKYSPARTIIGIRAFRRGDEVRLQVLDKGEGIPQAEIAHIFDKFYRVEGAGSGATGTGLGLSICRGFVEAMGGRVQADNRHDGPGAVFTIALPALG